LIGGAALDLTGFTQALAILGPTPSMPAEITARLALIAGPGAGLISAVSVVALVFYRLDAAKHTRIQRDIAARKLSGA
jgi:Na+/melibiose symporter-like transporter